MKKEVISNFYPEGSNLIKRRLKGAFRLQVLRSRSLGNSSTRNNYVSK